MSFMLEAEKIVKKQPNTKSPVFGLRLRVGEGGTVLDDGKAVCLHCKKDVSARWGNTSNLLSHLRSKHHKEYEQAVSTKKAQPSSSRASQNSDSSSSQLTITESLSRTIGNLVAGNRYFLRTFWQRTCCPFSPLKNRVSRS